MISGGVMRGIVEAPAGIVKLNTFGPAVSTVLPPVRLACSNALPTSTVTGWTGTGATVAVGTGFDRNTVSGFVITDDATGSHAAYQSFTATSAIWTLSVYLKAGTKSWAFVTPDGGSTGVYVNISGAALGTLVGGGTATVTSVGDSWCRVTYSQTLVAGARQVRIYLATGDGGLAYAGDGAGTISIYGPQIELGSTATDYNVTAGTAYVTRRFLPPTISVVASPSGGNMVAAGATVTKYGTPTTVDGYLTKAVSLNGSTDWFSLGTLPFTNSLTLHMSFKINSIATPNILVAKLVDSETCWQIYSSGTNLYFATWSGASEVGEKILSIGSFVVGEWSTVAVSYDGSPGNGSAIMRSNLDGTAASRSDASAPLYATSIEIGLGARASGVNYPLNGEIENCSIFNTFSASAAELAEIVKVYRTKQVAPYGTPTVECIAAPSGGDMIARGATVTKVGTPTTMDAYSYPVRKAVKLNGTTDWFNLGDVGQPGTAFTVVCVANSYGVAKSMFGRCDAGYTSGWILWHNATDAYLFTPGAEGATVAVSAAEGRWHVFAASYDGSGGAGATICHINVNGVAASSAGIGGLATNPAGASLLLGTDAGGQIDNGQYSYAAFYSGWAASPAQLANIVAVLQSKMISQPAETKVTYTCSATTTQNSTGALFEIPTSVPAVTSGGIALFGTNENSNKVTDSDNLSDWMKDAAVTISPNDALCPMSPDGFTRMTLVSNVSFNEGVWLDVADTPCRGVWLAKVSGDPDFTLRFCDPANTHNQEPVLTSTPTRYMDYYAGEHGIYLYNRSVGPNRFCVWRATLQNTSVCAATNPAPKTTAGTPFVGSPSLLSLPTQVTDVSNWTRTIRAKLNTWVGTGASGYSIFWSNGLAAGANSATLYLSGTALQIYVYNGAAVKYWTSGATGLVAGQEHEITVTNVAGTVNIYVDGRPLALIPAGAGTGIQESIPATVYLSTDSLHGYYLNGFVSDFREW